MDADNKKQANIQWNGEVNETTNEHISGTQLSCEVDVLSYSMETDQIVRKNDISTANESQLTQVEDDGSVQQVHIISLLSPKEIHKEPSVVQELPLHPSQDHQEDQQHTSPYLFSNQTPIQSQQTTQSISMSSDTSTHGKGRLSLKRPRGAVDSTAIESEYVIDNLDANDDGKSNLHHGNSQMNPVLGGTQGTTPFLRAVSYSIQSHSKDQFAERHTEEGLSPSEQSLATKKSRIQLSSPPDKKLENDLDEEKAKPKTPQSSLHRSPPPFKSLLNSSMSLRYSQKPGVGSRQADDCSVSDMSQVSVTTSSAYAVAQEGVSKLYSFYLEEVKVKLQMNRSKFNEFYRKNKHFRESLRQDTVGDTNSVHSDDSDFQGEVPKYCHSLKQLHDVSQGVTWIKAIHNIPIQDQQYRGFTVEEDYDGAVSASHVGKYVGDDYDDTYARDKVMDYFLSKNTKDSMYKKAIANVTRYVRSHRYTSEKRIDQRLAYILEVSSLEEADRDRALVDGRGNGMDNIRNHFCMVCMRFCCMFHDQGRYDAKINPGHWSGVDQRCLDQAASEKRPEGWNAAEWELLLRGLRIIQHDDLSKLQKFISTKTAAEIEECIKNRNLYTKPITLHKEIKAGEIEKMRRNQLCLLQKIFFKTRGIPISCAPCQHTGKCTSKGCPCARVLHLCTKACRCPPDCPLRFRGCACEQSCSTNKCTCNSYGFECDPDICRCGKKSRIGCVNNTLVQGRSKKVYIAKSKMPGAGWGLFLAEDVAKNEIILEYTGELVTKKETERRDYFYKIYKKSYVFRLTHEYDVDAWVVATEARYMNHSNNPNCQPKCVFSHGMNRLGMYALRDLCRGEELSFNYQYDRSSLAAYSIKELN